MRKKKRGLIKIGYTIVLDYKIRNTIFTTRNKIFLQQNTKFYSIPACYSLREKSSTSCAWTAWLERRSRFQIRRWRGNGGTQRRGKDLGCLASLERRRDATLMRCTMGRRPPPRSLQREKGKKTLQLLPPLRRTRAKNRIPRLGWNAVSALTVSVSRANVSSILE